MTIKTKLILVSALTCLITLGVFGFIRKQERLFMRRYEMTTVLRVTQNLSFGTELNGSNTVLENIPVQYAEPLFFKTKSDILEGNRPRYLTRIALTKGQQLTKLLVTPIEEVGGLGWLIPQGKLAFTLNLSREEGVSQLLSPGDNVHVYASHSATSEPVVSNAVVFALNNNVLGQVREKKNEEATLYTENGNVFVTLLLSETEVKQCLHSLKSGRLALAAVSFLGE